jgi:hypothetical protein
VYEPVRGFVEKQIDTRSAESQSEWINYELIPALERDEVDPAELAAFVIDYLNGLPRWSATRKTREIEYIESVRDGDDPPRTKREILVRHAASELGAFRLLDRFKSLATGD